MWWDECVAATAAMPLTRSRLHHNDIVVLRRRVALELVAAQRDLVADQLVAELERIEPVAGDGAVAQPDHRAAQDRFELVLQFIEMVDAGRVFHPLADIEHRKRTGARRQPNRGDAARRIRKWL